MVLHAAATTSVVSWNSGFAALEVLAAVLVFGHQAGLVRRCVPGAAGEAGSGESSTRLTRRMWKPRPEVLGEEGAEEEVSFRESREGESFLSFSFLIRSACWASFLLVRSRCWSRCKELMAVEGDSEARTVAFSYFVPRRVCSLCRQREAVGKIPQ
jgi:hypothetical protein